MILEISSELVSESVNCLLYAIKSSLEAGEKSIEMVLSFDNDFHSNEYGFKSPMDFVESVKSAIDMSDAKCRVTIFPLLSKNSEKTNIGMSVNL